MAKLRGQLRSRTLRLSRPLRGVEAAPDRSLSDLLLGELESWLSLLVLGVGPGGVVVDDNRGLLQVDRVEGQPLVAVCCGPVRGGVREADVVAQRALLKLLCKGDRALDIRP